MEQVVGGQIGLESVLTSVDAGFGPDKSSPRVSCRSFVWSRSGWTLLLMPYRRSSPSCRFA